MRIQIKYKKRYTYEDKPIYKQLYTRENIYLENTNIERSRQKSFYIGKRYIYKQKIYIERYIYKKNIYIGGIYTQRDIYIDYHLHGTDILIK